MNAIVAASTENMSREAWLEFRKKGIGGSDVAAACGLSQWKSPVALWLEKTGQVEPEPAGEAAYWGSVMEALIREEFTNRTGLRVRQVQAILQHQRFPFMLANLDGVVNDPDRGEGIFEAKTASAYTAPDWEMGIPDQYALQVQHYMAVTGMSFVYVAVLIGGNKFMWRLVERDEAVIDLIIQMESRFWKLVLLRIPPQIDGSKASLTLLNRLYPTGVKSSIELPPEALTLISQYEDAQDKEKKAAEEKELASNKLKVMLKEHELGVIDDRQVSWKSIKGERLDTKSLKMDLPDIYKQYIRESSYRRFSIK